MSRFFVSNWWPSRFTRRHREILFAEALSQSLDAGLEISAALSTAADVNCNRRFRQAIRAMSANCRQGNSLKTSLELTQLSVTSEFLAVLEIGEERGLLADRLADFVQVRDSRGAQRLADAVCRSRSTRRFASALAGLLEVHRLTPDLLVDAARLADGESSRLVNSVRQVAADLEDGLTLAEALRRQPSYFDHFFCRLIDSPENRAVLRRTLRRLAGAEARQGEASQIAGERAVA